MIRKGDKVTHKDGRTGTAARDEYTAFSGWQAVVIWWDGSNRVPVPSRADKLVKCATAGCHAAAVMTVTYSFPESRDIAATDRTCRPCAESYARRPSLKATIDA